jgi:hypothetical protein
MGMQHQGGYPMGMQHQGGYPMGMQHQGGYPMGMQHQGGYPMGIPVNNPYNDYGNLLKLLPDIISKIESRKGPSSSKEGELFDVLREIMEDQRNIPAIPQTKSEMMLKDIMSDSSLPNSPMYNQQNDLARFLSQYSKLIDIYKVDSKNLSSRLKHLSSLLSENTQVSSKQVNPFVRDIGPLLEDRQFARNDGVYIRGRSRNRSVSKPRRFRSRLR